MFESVMTALAERLIRRWTRHLPEDRQRYREEWLAEVEEVAGADVVHQLWFVLGLRRAAESLGQAESSSDARSLKAVLPAPEVLAEYDALYPGFADRLIQGDPALAARRRNIELIRASAADSARLAVELVLPSLLTLGSVAATALTLSQFDVGGALLASIIPLVVSAGFSLSAGLSTARMFRLRELQSLTPGLLNVGQKLATDRELFRRFFADEPRNDSDSE